MTRRLDQWMNCRTADGRPLPVEKCNAYRARRGLPELHHSRDAVMQSSERSGKPVGSRKKRCRPRGPGDFLGALLARLGIRVKCWGCQGRAKKMNGWGIAGCRERRAEIVGWLQEQRAEAGWFTQARVFACLVTTGLILRIDVRDPLGWLVDEALRRAEAETCACDLPKA